jgi:O-antigen/teichoic acid export membrane protein
MNLIKTSLYSSISTCINLISGFIVIKVVAVQIGPKGIAFVGQFQNATAILSIFATAAISTGVVKYLSEHKNSPVIKQRIINTAFFIVLVSSIIISLFVLEANRFLSKITFKSSDFEIIYTLFGLFTLTISFNIISSAILNGLQEIKKFTIVNISSSLINVTATVIFAYAFGLVGVLIANIAVSIIIAIINIYFFIKLGIKPDLKSWDKSMLKLFLGFSLMAIVSGLLSPFIQIMVRDRIIRDLSVVEAGYWQAVTKISDYYLGFITSVLGIYYLPRLSEIKNRIELKNEIEKGYKIILPAVGSIAFLIWLLKDVVIHILFTPSFLPMKPLFAFQLLGDFFKIGSWLLGYLMIAKAMVKTFIVTEIIFSISYVMLSYYFINEFGVVGTTYSFCIIYLAHWALMWVLMRKYIW